MRHHAEPGVAARDDVDDDDAGEDHRGDRHADAEVISLNDAARHLLNECRMVLPGIQALFGFQLIALFQPSFAQRLSEREQQLHLVAIVLVVLAIALVMAPAAVHRQHAQRVMTRQFVTMSSRLLLTSMLVLATALLIEVHLVAEVILGAHGASIVLVSALGAVFGALWLVLPRSRAFCRLVGGPEERDAAAGRRRG
jgi:hydrogenase-4 membrane subunit HyfE